MSDLAGFGVPGWLPPRVARRMAADDAHERAELAREQRERSDHADARRDQALASYRSAAEARGDLVSVLDMAQGGEGLGRSLGEILGDARAAADRQDALTRRAEQRARGEAPEILVWPVPPAMAVGEEPDRSAPAAGSAIGRELASRSRKLAERVAARRSADDADAALRDVTPELGAAWRRESHRSDVPAEPASVSADEAWRRAYVRMGGYVL